MPKTDTHNEIMIRPPPGTRFMNWIGGDMVIQFPHGKEREIINWLHDWIDMYLVPEAIRVENIAKLKLNPEPKIELSELNPEISNSTGDSTDHGKAD